MDYSEASPRTPPRDYNMQNFQFATHVLYRPSEMRLIKIKFFTDFCASTKVAIFIICK